MIAILAGAFLATASPAEDGPSSIPDHPAKLSYPELDFIPPARDDHRHVLPSGVPVYVVEDHDLPLVDVTFLVRTGEYLDPPGKEGLAAITGFMIRAGGTDKMTPEDVDEELAYLAAEVSCSVRDTQGSASFNCLSRNIDRVLEIFLGAVRTPRFDQKRLDLKKSQDLQDLARRNDRTAAIEDREWEKLLRGKGFFTTDRVTSRSVEGISREDLIRFHKESFHPRNFIVAVSGDVETRAILDKLEAALGEWARQPLQAEPKPIPRPEQTPVPGVYIADKPGVNQGRATIGQLAAMRNDADYHALFIMNQILGGSGFTSRITSRVRSDEGLAYTAGSQYEFGVYFPGIFRAFFQSKSASVAEAAGIAVEEIERMRSGEPSPEEVETAVNHAIGLLPRSFSTPGATALTLAGDELTGRDPSFWRTYRQKMKAVTARDVLRVSREWLHPDRLVVLVVGDRKEILAGNPARPEWSLEKLAGPGGVKAIPLPDPLTLEVPR
jgi:predicted Zn-dependent peptidase